jgi:hypothetical protein
MAEQILKDINKATDDLIKALAPLEQTESPEELKRMKMGLGRSVVFIAENMLKPIYIKFPDLIPPEMKSKDGGMPFLFR